jgi:CHRD domain
MPGIVTNGGKAMKSFTNSVRRAVALAAAVALVSGVAFAADVKVSLNGAEETPPVTTTATGTGSIHIAADKAVSGSVKTSGIEGTVAHIHVGAVGKSGPPIITLTKNPDGSWAVPAGSKLTDEQYASFKAGELYVNVHSAEHKGGEIRAQLKP